MPRISHSIYSSHNRRFFFITYNKMPVTENVLSMLAGYSISLIPPYHDRSKGKASALIVGCIDPRYSNDLNHYLTHSLELHADYDLINFAGASIGILSKPNWAEMFWEHLDLAKSLHGITEVHCFNHLDCGMAKATFQLEKDDKPELHLQQMRFLQEAIKNRNPELTFKGFLITQYGVISQVI